MEAVTKSLGASTAYFSVLDTHCTLLLLNLLQENGEILVLLDGAFSNIYEVHYFSKLTTEKVFHLGRKMRHHIATIGDFNLYCQY